MKLTLASLIAATSLAQADISNGDFNLGLSGWTLSVEGGSIADPNGAPYISFPWDAHGPYLDVFAFQGFFAMHTGPFNISGPYEITVSQTFDVQAGDLISGLGGFGTKENSPFFGDTAWVTIDGEEVWRLRTADVLPAPVDANDISVIIDVPDDPHGVMEYNSPWVPWAWVVSDAGPVELALHMFADGEQHSRGYFDSIAITPNQAQAPPAIVNVPDTGSTFALALMSLLLLAGIHKREI